MAARVAAAVAAARRKRAANAALIAVVANPKLTPWQMSLQKNGPSTLGGPFFELEKHYDLRDVIVIVNGST